MKLEEGCETETFMVQFPANMVLFLLFLNPKIILIVSLSVSRIQEFEIQFLILSSMINKAILPVMLIIRQYSQYCFQRF